LVKVNLESISAAYESLKYYPRPHRSTSLPLRTPGHGRALTLPKVVHAGTGEKMVFCSTEESQHILSSYTTLVEVSTLMGISLQSGSCN